MREDHTPRACVYRFMCVAILSVILLCPHSSLPCIFIVL